MRHKIAMNNSEPEGYLTFTASKIFPCPNLKSEIDQCGSNGGASTTLFTGNLSHGFTQNNILVVQIFFVEASKKYEIIGSYLNSIAGDDGRAHCRIRGANFISCEYKPQANPWGFLFCGELSRAHRFCADGCHLAIAENPSPSHRINIKLHGIVA